MYKVIDNIIPKSYQEQLKRLFDDGTMTWQFRAVTAGVEDAVDRANKNIKENSMFVHGIYDFERGIQSPTFDQVKPILFFAEEKLNMTVDGLGRMKANLTVKDETAKGFYHPPHVDTGLNPTGIYALVYYINDSDGPLIIFDKKVDDPGGHINLKEIGRVEPKQGRAVIIDSYRYHASSSPTENESRLVLNLVFFSKDLILPKTIDNNA